MSVRKTNKLGLAIGALAFVASLAHADCDDYVKRLRTAHLYGTSLCELQSRYKAAFAKLKEEGISDPTHVGNVLAPRFIERKTWTEFLSKYGDSKFAAWEIYKPAPITWGNWRRADTFARGPSTMNLFDEGSINDILAWMLKVHKLELDQLLPDQPQRVGKFRVDVAEIIPLHYISNAYTAADIDSIAHTPFVSSRTGQKIMNYVARDCIDTPVTASKVSGFFFKLDASNLREPVKACGTLTMAPQEEVMEQMAQWAAYLKNGVKALNTEPEKVDLLSFVARLQQWFVVVHPFVDGNGRTSRLMMDTVLSLLHLPTVVLEDMDRDFFSTPDEWADLVGRGLINSVAALEECAQTPGALGCMVVSSSPPSTVEAARKE